MTKALMNISLTKPAIELFNSDKRALFMKLFLLI